MGNIQSHQKDETANENSITISNLPTQRVPRVCFLSIFHLFMEWREIPPSILNDCLILLDCRRSFFKKQLQCGDTNVTPFSPNSASEIDAKTQCDTQFDSNDYPRTATEVTMLSLDISAESEFIEFIHMKESQGTLLWVDRTIIRSYDRSIHRDIDILIDEKWQFISTWLQIHCDPITKCNYNSLKFNQNWWRTKFRNEISTLINPPKQYCYNQLLTQINHCDDINKIIYELMRCKFNFQCVSEVIHQSNSTLVPMAKWNETLFEAKSELCKRAFPSVNNATENEKIRVVSMSNEKISDNTAAELTKNINRVLIGIEDEYGFVHLY